MDPSTISSWLLAMGTLAAAAATWLSTSTRRMRVRARRQASHLEEATDYITESRRQRRVHNDEHHPTGSGAITIPPLPSFMVKEEDDA